MYQEAHQISYLTSARTLIDDVHSTLGKFRNDDQARAGKWLSGDKLHPTSSGLRIGKDYPEGTEDRDEMECDGQYFHYAVKWMHALSRYYEVTHDGEIARLAVEMAVGIYPKFMTPSLKRIYWKLSVDLDHPLVRGQGQSDALDGYITYSSLLKLPHTPSQREKLHEALGAFKGMLQSDMHTLDPLGIGGLLCDVWRLYQLRDGSDDIMALMKATLVYGVVSLRLYMSRHGFSLPPSMRLAFRELGLCIGFHAIQRFQLALARDDNELVGLIREDVTGLVDKMLSFDKEIALIEGCWMSMEGQSVDTWIEHWEINTVMLATCLVPRGFLGM